MPDGDWANRRIGLCRGFLSLAEKAELTLRLNFFFSSTAFSLDIHCGFGFGIWSRHCKTVWAALTRYAGASFDTPILRVACVGVVVDAVVDWSRFGQISLRSHNGLRCDNSSDSGSIPARCRYLYHEEAKVARARLL